MAETELCLPGKRDAHRLSQFVVVDYTRIDNVNECSNAASPSNGSGWDSCKQAITKHVSWMVRFRYRHLVKHRDLLLMVD